MNEILGSVLVIDDEKDVLKAIKDTLSHEGFEVHTAHNGKSGLEIAQRVKPNVILLDLRLPDIDGYDVCRQLKAGQETMTIPIIMVSTRSKDTEKVVGLEIGADDYLAKPYNPLELVARIRVALRRTRQATPVPQKIQSGPLRIDIEGRKVKVDGAILNLTRKEFDLIVTLMGTPGKVFTRPFLLQQIWGFEYDSMQGTVDTHIKTLRKKLRQHASLIETVTGIGYRWADGTE